MLHRKSKQLLLMSYFRYSAWYASGLVVDNNLAWN